jgi:hypothetical protein
LTVEISDEERKWLRQEFDKLLKDIQKGLPKLPPYKAIIYCQATYDQDFHETQKCVERVSPHVDYTVIVEDGSLTEEQRKWLTDHGCIVKTFEFKDNLPEMRNQYLEEAKKIDPYGWALISDPDELLSESLCRDLRKIVSAAEAEGYNMIGIYAHDIWIDLDKLDAGELEKEQPYKESGFWKYLLFKLSPNFRYEGVGYAKNVHETWFSPDMAPRSTHLRKEYFYEHRKTVQKIWRNAARNLFIGGSGDNLGALNPTWVELREITASLGIHNWREFESYLKKGNIDPKLKDFIVRHRSDSRFPWEAEVRELFKWYFWMHPEENVGGWVSEYTPPQFGSRAEVENYVTRCYFEVLGRAPDEGGKKHYVDAILKGEVKREDLPIIFFNSEEYREKFLRSRKDDISLCIMGYHEVMPMILESVETTKPFVDEIHVQGDDFTVDDVETLKRHGCMVHFEPWREHFSDYKNKCISHATAKWVLILDHDEIPTTELAENLRRLVAESEGGTKYNIVAFDSINVTVNKRGEVISQTRGEGKPLLHLNVKEPYYGNPHIWLKLNYYPWVGRKVTYAYKHVKEEGIDVVRAIRNVFLGGGGDNVREKNPLWIQLRALTDELGIHTFKDFLEYLRRGNVDPRLKDWFERAYVYPWHDNELKAFQQYYYSLHPEEA